MKQKRLDALADSIFGIVMTVLVFDINIPKYTGIVSDKLILKSLVVMYPLFLSFLLAFTLLFTYWRSHHFVASVLVKNIDLRFTNYNALFFFFVTLIPFSAHLFSVYNDSKIAIILFATNIIFVGLALFIMRQYAIRSNTIENEPFTKSENEHANMRILFPVFAALCAIGIAFVNKDMALFVFTFAILFNFSEKSTKYIFYIINIFRKKDKNNYEVTSSSSI